jgi:peptidoglycan/xylan/chitin deacetylase (PgdA/CDA1 family)
MRQAIRGSGLAVVLLLAAGYLVQLDDSAPAAKVEPVAVVAPQSLVAQGEIGAREYFITRRVHEIIPTGAPTITLPILMYHYVRTPPPMRVDWMGYKLSVSPEDFMAQMDWLAANGFHTVDFSDVRAYFAGARALPSKPVVITFDDGYQDLYSTAFPILATHRFKAVAYIVSSFVGQPRYVSKDQILEMDRGGIQIASHTVNHPNLAGSSFGSTMYQLVESKRWLEQLTGHPVVDFAYPSGKYSSQVIAALALAGYESAVTEQVALTHSLSDRYTWTRVRVGGGESMSDFIAGLGSSMPSIKVTDMQVKMCGEHMPQTKVDS